MIAACGSPREGAEEQAVSALTGPACANRNLKVLDLHADFGDIWAGRETTQTGKQASPAAEVSVDFSATVDAGLVNATFTPVDASGKCGGVVAAMPGTAIIGSTVWGTQSSNAARPMTPAPYNLFVQDSVSGIVSAGGPVAAGGTVTSSSFSVNASARQPAGLIAGGRAVLTSGAITGDVTYGVPSTIPQTVSVSGKKSQQSFDVAAAFQNLRALSTLLTFQPPNGTVQSSYGNVQLVGKSAGVNVFQLSAETLKQASSISIDVPNGASAIIGVTGASVDIVSKGISMKGVTASTLLWNLAGARFLRVASVALPGAVLAPSAHLSFDSGALNGTIVVRSFLSAGSGSLQHTPLKVPSVFAPSTPSSVALKAATPLVGGCTYQFQIPSSPALSAAGACLSAPLGVTFIVAAHPLTPAARELTNLQPDGATGTLGRLAARAGINTPVDAALARYASAIGTSAADLVAASASVPSATRPGQSITTYQQYAQGYPVLGYGYFVASQGGLFRSANGRVARTLPVMPVVPSQTITSAAALKAALTYLKIAQAPWTKKPASFQEPVGTLVVVPKSLAPKASDFVLAWSFRFGKTTGIADPADLQVDAVTGKVVASNPGRRSISTIDEGAKYTGQQIPSTVETVYSGTRSFSGAQYKNNDSKLVTTLSTKAVTADGALITAAGIGLDASSVPFGFSQYAYDPTPATPWTATEPDERSMASAQWALELSGSFLESLDVKVAGSPWRTVDGLGHQKVLFNYVTSASPNEHSSFYSPTFSDKDTANVYLTIKPSQIPVAPDYVSHEFSHVLLDSMRRGNGLGTMVGIKESGSIDEGLADLFTIALNHKYLQDLPAWYCLNFQGASGGTTLCDRNVAAPNGTQNPDLYLSGPLGFYIDYTQADPSLCKADVNDSCGVHENASIVSHWGYLLGMGSANLDSVPCDLQVAPLNADPDTAFRMALNIALLAAGTRTGVGVGLPGSATFAQFRDATMQIVDDLVAEGVYPPETVSRVAMAWAAVGLAPVTMGPTLAEPANQTGVYPWATFAWPTAGQDGQTGSSWDFQIANADFNGGLLYQNTTGITDTTTRADQTMGTLPLALPYDSIDTFIWRVRPHSDDPKWLACYPTYSFVGTTQPDPVKNLEVVSELEGDLVVPGPFVLGWDVVKGTTPPHYDVKLAEHDPECEDGNGVTTLPETGLSDDGTTATDNVDFVLQPSTTYFVNVQPVGPNGFDGAPSVGGCFSLELTTTVLPPPVQAQPGSVPIHPFSARWSASAHFATLGGAAKALIYQYDRDESGGCGATPLGAPYEATMSGTQAKEFAVVAAFRGDAVPNPTGYCWDVVAVAANGQKSAPMSPKGAFAFSAGPVEKTAPGVLIDLVGNRKPGPLSGGPDSYGKDVTFTWDVRDLPSLPAAPAYGFKLGRWPWLGLDAPDPYNCRGNSCQVGPTDGSLFTEVVRDGELVVTDGKASTGRYCWTVWPVYDDPEDPGTAWSRQPFVRVDPQLCYTSGPGQPTITCSNVPASGFKPEPVSCEIVFPYVPDAQATVQVDGADDGDAVVVQGCQVQPGRFQFYEDFYDCHVKITIAPKPGRDYVVRALAWNSDAYPPVMDETTLAKTAEHPFKTGACGGKGQDCCANEKCNDANLSCFADSGAVSNHSCQLTTLPEPKLIFDGICDPAAATSVWANDATSFLITEVPEADEFEIEFTDPDTKEVTARGPLGCEQNAIPSGRLCPAAPGGNALFCQVNTALFSFHWPDAEENAANQRAVAQRGGFRYATFRVRAKNGMNATSPYSRSGVMVSCIDRSICQFTEVNGLLTPVTPSPVTLPTDTDYLCDDLIFIQIAKNVAPPGTCVDWH